MLHYSRRFDYLLREDGYRRELACAEARPNHFSEVDDALDVHLNARWPTVAAQLLFRLRYPSRELSLYIPRGSNGAQTDAIVAHIGQPKVRHHLVADELINCPPVIPYHSTRKAHAPNAAASVPLSVWRNSTLKYVFPFRRLRSAPGRRLGLPALNSRFCVKMAWLK